MEFLNTKEIEDNIIKMMKKSEYYNELEKKLNTSYYFTNILNFPGIYVYSDSNGYHRDSVGDRGEKTEGEITSNLSSIYMEIFWSLASSLSFEWTDKRKELDLRREMFAIILNILESIDKEYEILGKERINRILLENPYIDK